jgi:alpha-L-rhamnosidase
MVENIGGIRTKGPAYKRIVIAPEMGGKLTSATTSYRSIRGTIATSWKKEGNKLDLTVTIPANTSAEVRFPPGTKLSEITEGGKALKDAKGIFVFEIVTPSGKPGKGTDFGVSIDSGTYHFLVKAK